MIQGKNTKLSFVLNDVWVRKTLRPCLVRRKFSVFCIQTFRKQGKRV